MTVQDLDALFSYGYWANQHLFEVLSHLPEEKFVKPVGGSYGSLRNTLVHILSAEWGWLERCGGAPRGPALKAPDYPTLAPVRVEWERVERHVRQFLSGLSDEDLERSITWAIGTGPQHTTRLGELLQHVAVHGAHHRGQVALLLRLLGHAPGNFDFLFYVARPRT